MQHVNLLKASEVKLSREDNGDVVLRIEDRTFTVGAFVGAFPISKKGQFVSVRSTDGDEIGILDNKKKLDHDSRMIVREEIERTYFMPKITGISDIRLDLNIRSWKVWTDKGPRVFQVKNPRQNVRSVGGNRFIIKDIDGNRYEIEDLFALSNKAQYLMAEFI
jgi:hypothetical protein